MRKIFLSIAAMAAGLWSVAAANVIDIKGKVISDKGEALAGVSVVVKGSSIGTVTDRNGEFSLKADTGATLSFSFLGFLTEETEAAGDYMNVEMEEDVLALEGSVVTTQKRRQTSVEVPAAVSALSGARMEHMGVSQMDDMAGFIPGLEVQLQSPNNPTYSIRGVTSDGMESYSQPRISLYVDGVSISRAQNSVVELYDMERVEVVKGPQGTLFGRGAEIGAMHFLRNKPSDKLSGEISLNYGTHNQRGASGFLNTPISQRLSNRFAFSYDAHDGYINNLAGGRLNGKSAIAVRNSTRLYSGQNTTMHLVLDYQYDDYPGTSFKNNMVAPEGGDTSPYTDAYLNGGSDLGITRHNGGALFSLEHAFSPSLQLTGTTAFRAYKEEEFFDADGTYLPLLDCYEGSNGLQFSQEFRLNWTSGGKLSGFVGASYFYEHAREEVYAISNLKYTFPLVVGSTIQSALSSLPETVTSGVVSGIESYVSLLSLAYPDYATIIEAAMAGVTSSLESSLLSSMNSLMDSWFSSSYWETTPDFYGDTYSTVSEILTAALEELFSTYPSISALLGGASASDIVASLGIESQLSSLTSYSSVELAEDYQENHTNYADFHEAGIFADATWNIARGLSLTAGLRGTFEHQKSGYMSTSDVLPLLGASLLYNSSDGVKVWTDKNYVSWVGRIALNYLFNGNNAYVSVSKGRRPGVIYFDYSPDDIIELKPETIISYEIGLKGKLLKKKLDYELAAYYYDWSHFQSSRLVENESGTYSYVPDDAGKAHSLGFEVGFRYNITRNINVFANYGYIDGKFNDKDGDGLEQELAGNRFRLTPKHSFAVGVDANAKLGKNLTGYLRPSYTYKSKIYFENENSEELSQDGYGILNCRLGVQWMPGKVYYEIGLFGKNILDEEYLIDAGNTGNTIGFPTFVAGSPSVFGVSVKLGF